MSPEEPIPPIKESAIVLVAAVVIASIITLLRYLAAAWKPIESTDLIIYWTGLQLFFSTNNPYDPQVMLAEQQKLSPLVSGLLVWNPPILFPMLSPFLHFPIGLARLIWSFFTTICTVLSAYFSAQYVGMKPLKFPIWIIFSVLFCPFLFELQVEQISSYLNLFFVLSILLFVRGHYGFSGFLAGMLIVKPHMFYLMLLWFFVVALLEKRRRFFLGIFLSLFISSGVAELMHPGINMQWLTRGSWMREFEGSTLPSLVRSVLASGFDIHTNLPLILIPALACAGLAIALIRSRSVISRQKILLLAIMLCPLTAPYGFVFDQAVLIVPIVAILACVYGESFSARQRLAVICVLAFLEIAIAGFPNTQVFGVILSWYALPIIVLGLFYVVARQAAASGLGIGPIVRPDL